MKKQRGGRNLAVYEINFSRFFKEEMKCIANLVSGELPIEVTYMFPFHI